MMQLVPQNFLSRMHFSIQNLSPLNQVVAYFMQCGVPGKLIYPHSITELQASHERLLLAAGLVC